MLLGESKASINSCCMRDDAEWEMMHYLQLCEFIYSLGNRTMVSFLNEAQ